MARHDRFLIGKCGWPDRLYSMLALSRRRLLFVGPVIVLGACTSDRIRREPQPQPSPDELLKRAVAADEARLLDMYAAAALAHPDLAEPLAPFVRRHGEHREAVGGRLRATPTPSATKANTLVAENPAAAVAELAEAEATAAEARRADCLRAQNGELARLLASIAACEALHETGVARL
jgi:hypothetical protein